jgi:hypothetical protein
MLATRIYCWLTTSSVLERTKRAMTPAADSLMTMECWVQQI